MKRRKQEAVSCLKPIWTKTARQFTEKEKTKTKKNEAVGIILRTIEKQLSECDYVCVYKGFGSI